MGVNMKRILCFLFGHDWFTQETILKFGCAVHFMKCASCGRTKIRVEDL